MKPDKFKNAVNNPFPHYWIEDFLTDEQYQKLIDMRDISEFVSVGDSCRSSVSLGHSDYHEQITHGLIDGNTKSTLIDVFWPSIIYQYPKATKDDVMKTAWVEGMIVKDVEGYEMPPHQDGGSFIVGYAQLFLAEQTDDYHGITLHRSLQPERKMNMSNAVNPDKQGDEYDAFYKDHPTEAVISYPYKKNCLYALGCDDTTWHEVIRVKPNFERYSAIWQLYWNERGDFI